MAYQFDNISTLSGTDSAKAQVDEIINKHNDNMTKIDTAIAEKITQVTLKSSLPTSPTISNNLYIVYGDTKDNNGQYRWNGNTYEKISTQLDYATKAEAEAGADNTKVMTPLGVREFFNANGGGSGGVINVVFKSGEKYYLYIATENNINTIVIPSNYFNPSTDVIGLILDDDNQPLVIDRDYTLVGNTVTIVPKENRETYLNLGQSLLFYITNGSYAYNKLSGLPDLSLKLDKVGDAKDTTVTFTESTTRENLVSGDKTSVLMGKIKKWFTDIWIALADKADVQWMSDGWKTENDSALTYPRSATTYFKVGTPSTNFPAYSTIKTELNSNGAGKQEVFGLNGQVVKYRLVKNDDSWGEWQIIATSADLEQKADKQWQVNDWKTESALPNTYPSGTTKFLATGTFGGLSGVIVTTDISSGIGVQQITRSNGFPLKFRLAEGGLLTWGAWQTIATTDKIDSLFENGNWTPRAWGVSQITGLIINNAKYYKTNKQVTAQANITFPALSTTENISFDGLPFIPLGIGFTFSCVVNSTSCTGCINPNGSFGLYNSAGALLDSTALSGKTVIITVIYMMA